MPVKIITPPSQLALGIDVLADRIGLNLGNLTPESLDSLIRSATAWVEHYTGRTVVTSTLELALDCFAQSIMLPGAPVQSIVSVKYTDPDGAEQTVAPAEYLLYDYGIDPCVMLAHGASWPAVRTGPASVRVRYIAGHDPDGIPPDMLNAITLIVSQAWRAQPGLESGLYPSGIPNAAKELLAPYRIMCF